jgi:hypothetical protein
VDQATHKDVFSVMWGVADDDQRANPGRRDGSQWPAGWAVGSKDRNTCEEMVLVCRRSARDKLPGVRAVHFEQRFATASQGLTAEFVAGLNETALTEMAHFSGGGRRHSRSCKSAGSASAIRFS